MATRSLAATKPLDAAQARQVCRLMLDESGDFAELEALALARVREAALAGGVACELTLGPGDLRDDEHTPARVALLCSTLMAWGFAAETCSRVEADGWRYHVYIEW